MSYHQTVNDNREGLYKQDYISSNKFRFIGHHELITESLRNIY